MRTFLYSLIVLVSGVVACGDEAPPEPQAPATIVNNYTFPDPPKPEEGLWVGSYIYDNLKDYYGFTIVVQANKPSHLTVRVGASEKYDEDLTADELAKDFYYKNPFVNGKPVPAVVTITADDGNGHYASSVSYIEPKTCPEGKHVSADYQSCENDIVQFSVTNVKVTSLTSQVSELTFDVNKKVIDVDFKLMVSGRTYDAYSYDDKEKVDDQGHYRMIFWTSNDNSGNYVKYDYRLMVSDGSITLSNTGSFFDAPLELQLYVQGQIGTATTFSWSAVRNVSFRGVSANCYTEGLNSVSATTQGNWSAVQADGTIIVNGLQRGYVYVCAVVGTTLEGDGLPVRSANIRIAVQ